MNENSMNNAVTMRLDGGASLGSIDQYELIRELGGGGFGTVYLARDSVSGVEVAVKGLPPLVKNNKEELENIRRNFALVSRLTHENIAKALVLHPVKSIEFIDAKAKSNLRVEEGDTLMVMDYASGVTLSVWRKQFLDGKVPLAKTIEIVSQIASALDYAHAQGIVHRDIKPSNIMIESRSDGSLGVSVLDFGLAAEIRTSMSRVSMMVTDMSGTRPYMAPEQWHGRKQGEATDQYALAVLTYELITGDVPFASVFSTGDPMLMMNVVGRELPEMPSDIPKSVRLALTKALAKKSDERFGSCSDFVHALEGKIKVGRTSRNKSSGGLKTLLHSKIVFFVLGFVLLCLGGGTWYYLDVKEKEQKRLEAERLEFLKNQKLAVELKVRATQAYNDAIERKINNIDELGDLFRQLNYHYQSGMVFFESTNYVAAIEAFNKIEEDMKSLIKAKQEYDEYLARKAEEERKRKELKRLVDLGYVLEGDQAIWKKGQAHKSNPLLESDATPETWKAIKAGWKWNGGDEVIWCSNVEHPKYHNWISSKTQGMWHPKIGYKPVGNVDNELTNLVWDDGFKCGDYRTTSHEGQWEKRSRCQDCSGSGRVSSRNFCNICSGSGKVEKPYSCVDCSGTGKKSVQEICSHCTGGTVFENCQSGCSEITRNGSVIFRHGFVCMECNGKGQKINATGIVGGLVAAGIAGALSSRTGFSPSMPQVSTHASCSRCSGVGGYVCSNCSGTGKTQSQCYKCNGTGRVSRMRKCNICIGEGKVNKSEICGSCRNGYVFSDVSCVKCNGDGHIWSLYGNAEHILTETYKYPIEVKE